MSQDCSALTTGNSFVDVFTTFRIDEVVSETAAVWLISTVLGVLFAIALRLTCALTTSMKWRSRRRQRKEELSRATEGMGIKGTWRKEEMGPTL